MHHLTDRITHTTTFVTPVVEHERTLLPQHNSKNQIYMYFTSLIILYVIVCIFVYVCVYVCLCAYMCACMFVYVCL